jgi:hypothetical protein
MSAQETFTNIDDNALIERISHAMQRVVFIAPGLREPAARALEAAFARLPGNVTVILDVDAEVCRLGYGDEKGLEAIQCAAQAVGTNVFHQPGVRIGLLIVDGDTIVYSPTPLLIEAGSRQPTKPNAIMLTANVPAAVEAACGLGAAGKAERDVGLAPVSVSAVEEVKKDLEERPPKEFNIARIERVFNSALHFVELEILDYRLKAKKVKLDAELFGLGDDYLRERVENTYKPFDDAEFLTLEIPKLDEQGNPVEGKAEKFGPAEIERERLRIKREFLFDIPRFGVVIRRASKQEFEQRLKRLEKQLQLYVEAVLKNIEAHVGKAKEKLKASLLDVVCKNPPVAWRKYRDGDHLAESEAGRLLDDALERAFAGIVSQFNPAIRWIYKYVTYETIHNQEFRKGLEKHFGKTRADQMFGEYDAAPEA